MYLHGLLAVKEERVRANGLKKERQKEKERYSISVLIGYPLAVNEKTPHYITLYIKAGNIEMRRGRDRDRALYPVESR